MQSEPPSLVKPPGVLWIALLGVAGFGAGFFGPLVFVPESNQGPLVGIFMSGPGGCLLGLVMYLLMKAVPLSGRRQWTLLLSLAAAGILVTLALVQPEPATRGYELELSVTRTMPPAAVADDVIADWKQRIARVTWAAPRNGWEAQLRTALASDSGIILEAVVLRERTIKEDRKPWNRGRLFTTPWQTKQQQKRFYLPPGVTVPASPGRMLIPYDSTARIRAPEAWPPVTLDEFIGYSRLEPVPPRFATLP